MFDFTSCSYLGLRHGAAVLPCFAALAEGRPASLHEPAGVAALGRALATLQGQEDGVVGTSSLLLAMDVLGPALRGPGWRILVDAGCYPTLRWATAQRQPPIEIAHHEPAALARTLVRLGPGQRPLLVVDGFCAGCGRAAPLGQYAGLLAGRAGRLLVDDTQALGLLGPGGAGTLPHQGCGRVALLCVASLAKAFGVPLALLSGPRQLIEAFRVESATRMYCSPPSRPVVAAAWRALALNCDLGGRLRVALRQAILTFRNACAVRGVPLLPGAFPLQTVVHAGRDAASLAAALATRGVRALVNQGFHDTAPRLRLVITATHSAPVLEAAAEALAAVLAAGRVALMTYSLEARNAAFV